MDLDISTLSEEMAFKLFSKIIHLFYKKGRFFISYTQLENNKLGIFLLLMNDDLYS